VPRMAKITRSFYPNLEEFLEQEQRSSVAEAFGPTREKLGATKGTKSAAAKKAATAIEKTEILLHHLFDVKERMAQAAVGKTRK
jgi:hypothetical protein